MVYRTGATVYQRLASVVRVYMRPCRCTVSHPETIFFGFSGDWSGKRRQGPFWEDESPDLLLRPSEPGFLVTSIGRVSRFPARDMPVRRVTVSLGSSNLWHSHQIFIVFSV